MSRNCVLGLVFVVAAQSGCYRSAQVELRKLKSIETTAEGRLEVRYTSGELETYSQFQQVRVESTEQGDHDFKGEVSVERERITLLIRDQTHEEERNLHAVHEWVLAHD